MSISFFLFFLIYYFLPSVYPLFRDRYRQEKRDTRRFRTCFISIVKDNELLKEIPFSPYYSENALFLLPRKNKVRLRGGSLPVPLAIAISHRSAQDDIQNDVKGGPSVVYNVDAGPYGLKGCLLRGVEDVAPYKQEYITHVTLASHPERSGEILQSVVAQTKSHREAEPFYTVIGGKRH